VTDEHVTPPTRSTLDGAGGATASSAPGSLKLDEVVALARRCLDADGGMPLAADPGFLRRRYLGDTTSTSIATTSTTTTAVRSADGTLVAASAVRPGAGHGAQQGTILTAMVDPGLRGRGIGASLLDAALAEAQRRAAQGRGGPVSVETESLTPAVARLFASRGLRQVFAEDVMRCDLTDLLQVDPVQAARSVQAGPVWPAGTTLADWSDATSTRFHAVYAASFADRPGFPGWSAQEWIEWSVDEDFRPGWSVLATLPGVGDAGFATCSDGWLVQVGVVPAARGGGLGGALVVEALRRMRADGATEVLLDVNVDNPAAKLYQRLGFVVLGRRARFEL
jgi:ribosomal protein S18 acetylase RimI-like enzyme